MRATIIVLLLTLCALWGETYLFSLIPYLRPDLFFLINIILILHWKGPETYFIAPMLGLLADTVSSLPFGISGLMFLSLVFPIRWIAIKIFIGAKVTLPVITLFFIVFKNLGLMVLTMILLPQVHIGNTWILHMFLQAALPTAVLSIPLYIAFIYLNDFYQIRLAERKY